MNTVPKSPSHQLHEIEEILQNPIHITFGPDDDALFKDEQAGYADPENLSRKNQFGIALMGIMATCAELTDPSEISAHLEQSVNETPDDFREQYAAALRGIRQDERRAFTNLPYDESYDVRHPNWDEGRIVNDWTSEQIENFFPNGDFLFHGTNLQAAASTIRTGAIMSSNTREKEQVEMYNEGIAPTKGGDFGISWNLNRVVTMPSDVGHICGFLAAPTTVQNHRLQFIVPTVSGDFEVQSISRGIDDIDAFKKLDAQVKLWGSASDMAQELGYFPPEMFYDNPVIERVMEDLDKISEIDDELYSYEDGVTVLAEGIYDRQITPLAVLVHSLIQGGDIEIDEKTSLKIQLRSIIEQVLTDDYLGDEFAQVVEKMRQIASNNSSVQIPTDEMIFVCSDKDAPYWIERFKRSKYPPAGIFMYDSRSVRVPNFVIANGLGDQEHLDVAIRSRIPATDKTANWESYFTDPVRSRDERNGAKYLVPITQTLSAKQPIFN